MECWSNGLIMNRRYDEFFQHSNAPLLHHSFFFLDMAGQTIIRHFAFRMTVHAPIHRHVHPWPGGWLLAFSDISMAGLTLQFSQNHMPTMGKEDVIGFSVNPFPGNLFSFFGKSPDLFFLRGLGHRLFMAFKAGGDVRNSRKVLGFEETVTCITPQTLFDMLFVVK